MSESHLALSQENMILSIGSFGAEIFWKSADFFLKIGQLTGETREKVNEILIGNSETTKNFIFIKFSWLPPSPLNMLIELCLCVGPPVV